MDFGFLARLAACFVVGTLMAFAPAARGAETQALKRFEFTETHMGVPFKLLFYARNEKAANRAAEAAFERVAELNSILSDYDPNSELSRLSATAGTNKEVALSRDLWRVLSAAQAVSRRSEGAFDVTVGPVVKLWRRARRSGEMPERKRLQAALQAVGYQHLELDENGKTARLLRPNMRLDLGGIAKGYAADEALEKLAEHGVRAALVDASGDLAVGAPPPGKAGWRIGVAPLEAEGKPSRLILVKNAGVATSGDAFQFVEIDGKRYSHIVDPRTGLGLTTRSSVTVIAPDGMTADSLASAVSVLGPGQGIERIEKTCNAEAIFVVRRDPGKVKTYASRGFSEYPIPSED